MAWVELIFHIEHCLKRATMAVVTPIVSRAKIVANPGIETTAVTVDLGGAGATVVIVVDVVEIADQEAVVATGVRLTSAVPPSVVVSIALSIALFIVAMPVVAPSVLTSPGFTRSGETVATFGATSCVTS